MAEYYFENFESYSELFRKHALYVSELMKILDDEIIGMGLPPVGRAKDLFRMTLDLTYPTDRAYKEMMGLKENETAALHSHMEPQRIKDIKAALSDMSMEELQEMSDNLNDLISVLITRQVAVEDAILDRLESAFANTK